MKGQDAKVVSLNRKIHETAIVSPEAKLGLNVEIGPYAIIGDNVEIGDGTVVGPHAVISGWTIIGKNNKIGIGATVGSDPQDLKYGGEKTYLFIGDDNIIREYAAIHRGTEGGGGETRIGNGNLIMTYVHVGHDCKIGNRCVIVSGAALAGHVIIEDRAVIGGMSGIHQFCRVGSLAMVGALTKVSQDVPPFMTVDGHPARVAGINVVGLRRNGVAPEVRSEIKKAFRLLYRSGLNVTQAIQKMEQDLANYPETDHFIRFLHQAERGVCQADRNRKAKTEEDEE